MLYYLYYLHIMDINPLQDEYLTKIIPQFVGFLFI